VLQISVFGVYYVNQVSTFGDLKGTYLKNIKSAYTIHKTALNSYTTGYLASQNTGRWYRGYCT